MGKTNRQKPAIGKESVGRFVKRKTAKRERHAAKLALKGSA